MTSHVPLAAPLRGRATVTQVRHSVICWPPETAIAMPLELAHLVKGISTGFRAIWARLGAVEQHLPGKFFSRIFCS